MRKFEIVLLESTALQRIVRVYVKLPKTYHASDKTYPVLYIHDGQIGFNDYEKDEIDWGLFDDYMKVENPEVIIVGIANKDTRINELFPYELNTKDRGILGGKTDLYFDFIINQLKPMIDDTYRTKSDAKYTGLMGVSLGGVGTVYAMTKYTGVFTRFASISGGFFQLHERLFDEVQKADVSRINKVYTDVGTNEHEDESIRARYVTTNQELCNVLKEKLENDAYQFNIFEGSKHDFSYWNKRVPNIIKFLFQDEE